VAFAPDAGAEDIERHGKALIERSKAMSNLFFGMGKIIRLIFDASTPAGWLRLGLKIADELKDAAKEMFGKQHLGKA
jgi:hypothetical protein